MQRLKHQPWSNPQWLAGLKIPTNWVQINCDINAFTTSSWPYTDHYMDWHACFCALPKLPKPWASLVSWHQASCRGLSHLCTSFGPSCGAWPQTDFPVKWKRESIGWSLKPMCLHYSSVVYHHWRKKKEENSETMIFKQVEVLNKDLA